MTEFTEQFKNSVYSILPTTTEFIAAKNEWIDIANAIREVGDALYGDDIDARNRFIAHVVGLEVVTD